MQQSRIFRSACRSEGYRSGAVRGFLLPSVTLGYSGPICFLPGRTSTIRTGKEDEILSSELIDVVRDSTILLKNSALV